MEVNAVPAVVEGTYGVGSAKGGVVLPEFMARKKSLSWEICLSWVAAAKRSIEML